MRRLLLLLLTLLIPLQLLAATGESQLREQLRDHLPVQLHGQQQAELPALAAAPGGSCQSAAGEVPPLAHPQALLADDAAQGDESGSPTDDDDRPSLQGELEDPTLPARIATPDALWYPFPHAFPATLSWSSYLRDQLRPPPLA